MLKFCTHGVAEKTCFVKNNSGKDGIIMQVRTHRQVHNKYKDYNDLKTAYMSPNRIPEFPSEYMSQNKYFNNERPLKTNSMNLSFEGLSFMGNKPAAVAKSSLNLLDRLLYKQTNTTPYSKESFLQFADKYTDFMGRELFENLEKSKLAKKLLHINGDEVTLYKKRIPQLVWDGLIYPVKILPFDLLNGSIAMLGKIKPLKKWSDNVLKTDFFKNIRQRSKFDSKFNALRGLMETQATMEGKMKDGKFLSMPQSALPEDLVNEKMIRQKLKMYDPKKGSYDTKHERSLNRLVSGLPPAIFLANDAYNLSRMMDDDPVQADKERKTRFKQEVARIVSSGYLTLVTLGALQKYINNSKLGIMLMTGVTVLITEMFSRLSNGKYITRLTPEEARAINEKNNAPEAKIKPVEIKEQPKDVAFKGENQTTTPKPAQQKPLLSFDTLMKASAVVIGAGYAIKGLRKFKMVDNIFNTAFAPFKDFYRKITVNPDYKMPVEKFDKIMEILERKENGFYKQAQDFRNFAKEHTANGYITFGEKDKRAKIAVDFVIAPFKFAYNTVTLPYRYTNQLLQFAGKNLRKALKIPEKPKSPSKIAEELANAKSKAEKARLADFRNAIDRIGREALKDNYNAKDFKTFVSDMTMKAFNVDSLSNISNSDLSNLAKTASTAATLWFLMTDNYNMVMLKSNGNDKEGANTKFKERFVQEGSRLFYQTLLIDLFNSTFRNQYNRSLAGMSWITLVDTTLGEILTRKSVGTPVKQHTRDELIAMEDAQNNATGFLKGYYNFMKRLTGKRPIRSYEVDNTKNQKTVISQPQQFSAVNFTNQNSVLTQMIKG